MWVIDDQAGNETEWMKKLVKQERKKMWLYRTTYHQKIYKHDHWRTYILKPIIKKCSYEDEDMLKELILLQIWSDLIHSVMIVTKLHKLINT